MDITRQPTVRSGTRASRLPRTLCLQITLLLLAACATPPAAGTALPGPLDPDVPPVTGGTWARVGTDTSWQWQLQGAIDKSYDVDLYDIDLFDVSEATIASLRGAGRTVICYLSAGSFEEWRPDADSFAPADLGATLSGFTDERWLDIRSGSVHAVMLARLDLAAGKGCDGVEPDNVQAYLETTGFDLTALDQLAFNRFLFNAAHERGLAVALKNGLEQIPELVDYVDFAVNEQCHEFDECDAYRPFLEASKGVLNAEYKASYRSDPDALCRAALLAGLRTLVLDEELDNSFRYSCDSNFAPTSSTGLAKATS